MENNRKLLSIMLMLLMILLNAGCAEKEIDESTKREVDGIIFENDLMRITGVSTDEYVDGYKTKTVRYTYFSTDYQGRNPTNLLSFGETVIIVTPGESYLEKLPCSVLSVLENGTETTITDKLEEFFICEDADGNIAIYYATYHMYAESEEKDIVEKYVTLKAYKIEFMNYTSASKLKTEEN